MLDRLYMRLVLGGFVLLALSLGGPGSVLGVEARYVVGVSGMICPTSCTTNVREALETLPEVQDVAIDFAAKTATITTHAGETLTRDQVHKALKGSGFGVTTFEIQFGSGS